MPNHANHNRRQRYQVHIKSSEVLRVKEKRQRKRTAQKQNQKHRKSLFRIRRTSAQGVAEGYGNKRVQRDYDGYQRVIQRVCPDGFRKQAEYGPDKHPRLKPKILVRHKIRGNDKRIEMTNVR